jgi:hypothetical protein
VRARVQNRVPPQLKVPSTSCQCNLFSTLWELSTWIDVVLVGRVLVDPEHAPSFSLVPEALSENPTHNFWHFDVRFSCSSPPLEHPPSSTPLHPQPSLRESSPIRGRLSLFDLTVFRIACLRGEARERSQHLVHHGQHRIQGTPMPIAPSIDS